MSACHQAGADSAQDCRLLTLAVLFNQYQGGSAYDSASRISVEPSGASVPTRDFHAKDDARDGIVVRSDDRGQATLDVLRALAFGNVDDDGGRLLETAIFIAKRRNRARRPNQRAIFSQKTGIHLKTLVAFSHRFKEPVCLGDVSGKTDIPGDSGP
ncbi:hypothetical protein [Ensifer sp. ENS04]|uniref:hypothetical protein n=1 Tax=Ensifer sp. ENS04 TaxID=2769281 RepID=UPI001FEE3D88|nr:hypothetical protein [Ensifer sp. ENS04]